MGMPHGITNPILKLGMRQKHAQAARNSAVGNSFHVPSVYIMLMLLFSIAEAVWVSQSDSFDSFSRGLNLNHSVMEQIEKKWHAQQIGGVFRLVAGSWRRLHALKKKSKGDSRALQAPPGSRACMN